jgi:hypothetical protein
LIPRYVKLLMKRSIAEETFPTSRVTNSAIQKLLDSKCRAKEV